MTIEANGASAWPSGLQEIRGVPYQLIITLPEYTWIAIAQLSALFLAAIALVVFVTRKRLGYGWGSVVGLVVALAVVAPQLMFIDFGPKRFEPISPDDRVKPLELEPLTFTPEAREQYISAMCADKTLRLSYESQLNCDSPFI